MVKVGDIFLAESRDFDGRKRKHYYYCIYSQREDKHNHLYGDIVGLLITTNEKMEAIVKNNNDYNVKIKLYYKNAYICCDKMKRLKEENVIDNKGDLLDDFEKKQALIYYSRFLKETLVQLKGGK